MTAQQLLKTAVSQIKTQTLKLMRSVTLQIAVQPPQGAGNLHQLETEQAKIL